jgi:hypothetical protein
MTSFDVANERLHKPKYEDKYITQSVRGGEIKQMELEILSH